jgi:hypothetical protein
MKAYGLTRTEYENDSKKIGDYWGSRKPRSYTSDRNALRQAKKRARREAKKELTND